MHLGLRCAGHLHCGRIFHRSDEHIAAVEERHHLAVGGYNRILRLNFQHFHLLRLIGDNLDCELARSGSVRRHGVELTIVGESHDAVGGTREESHGMSGKIGETARSGGVGHREGPDIEAASIAFAEDIDGFAVGRDHRVAVLAGTVGQVGMLTGGEVKRPHVARHR